MQVQSAAAASSAYLIQSTRQSAVQQQQIQQQAAKSDSVEISPAGRSLLSTSLIPEGNIQDQIIADRAWMNDKLKELLGEDAGNYTFEIGYDGHVNVSGEDKARAAELEKAFENDFELHNHLARISANSSLLRAAREHEKFAKAYEQDPEAAVAQFSYLFDGSNRAEVRFEYGEDGLQVYFESLRKGTESLEDYLNGEANA